MTRARVVYTGLGLIGVGLVPLGALAFKCEIPGFYLGVESVEVVRVVDGIEQDVNSDEGAQLEAFWSTNIIYLEQEGAPQIFGPYDAGPTVVF